MTGAYKLNDIAYMIESNHYIREGKIIHISGDLITFKFLDCIGATKIKAHRLYHQRKPLLPPSVRIKLKFPAAI